MLLLIDTVPVSLSQDGAGGGRSGPAGGNTRGQQILVRGPPGISRERDPAALDVGETRGSGGSPLRPATGNGRDSAAGQ